MTVKKKAAKKKKTTTESGKSTLRALLDGLERDLARSNERADRERRTREVVAALERYSEELPPEFARALRDQTRQLGEAQRSILDTLLRAAGDAALAQVSHQKSGKRQAQRASAGVRGRRKNIVLDVQAKLAARLNRDPTQPEIVTEMQHLKLIRKGEKGRQYIYTRDGERVGKPLPAGTYPLKNILRKNRSR